METIVSMKFDFLTVIAQVASAILIIVILYYLLKFLLKKK